MEKIRAFLRRKDIVFSAKRYFIDAMGAMAQGLFCTLLVGTILNTIGQQFHIGFLNAVIVTIGKGDGAVNYTIGGLCSAMVGPGMAVAIAGALEIGGARLENLEVRVSEKFPELLIGAHVLQHYVLAIDQRSQRVALCGKPR